MLRQMGIAVTLVVALMVLMAGCGGGGDAAAPVGTASVEGTVYAPGVSAASAAGQGEPAAFCQVYMEQAQSRQRLGSTETNVEGRYRFEGLQAGQDVIIAARLQTGDLLRTRLRLQDGSCQADIDENTTVATAAADMLSEPGPGGEGEMLGTVAQICEQYQRQYRYQYGEQNGQGPNFSDEEDVEQAAQALLAAATDDAIQVAMRTRTQADCEGALTMLTARLRQCAQMQFSWDDETMQGAANAMQERKRIRTGELAEVASEVFGADVPEGEVIALREQLREQVRAFNGEDMEMCEGLAGLCLGEGDHTQLRLQTREQVRECIRQMLQPNSG